MTPFCNREDSDAGLAPAGLCAARVTGAEPPRRILPRDGRCLGSLRPKRATVIHFLAGQVLHFQRSLKRNVFPAEKCL